MGDLYLLELADVLDQALIDGGLPPLKRYDGWETRSRSSGGYDDPYGPLCCMWHHTAGSGETGASWGDAHYECEVADARPIANVNMDPDPIGYGWSGVLMSVARTNTNGSGSGSPREFSRGWCGEDDMNNCAFGMEIANNGVGGPYRQAQIDAAFIVSNTVNAFCHNQPDDVCTHTDYAPERKVDPATAWAVEGPWQPDSCSSSGSWDLDDLKAECLRRASAGGEDDMPLSQEDIDKIAEAVWAKMIDTTGSGEPDPQPARYYLQRGFLISRQYLGSFSGKPAKDPTMLKQIFDNTEAKVDDR